MEVERRRHVEPINDSCSCKSTTAYTRLHTRVCVLVCVCTISDTRLTCFHSFSPSYNLWRVEITALFSEVTPYEKCTDQCLRMFHIFTPEEPSGNVSPLFIKAILKYWWPVSSLCIKSKERERNRFFFLPSGVGVSWLCGAARNYANHIWVKVNHLVLWNYNQLLLIHEGKWATCGKVESLLTLTLFVCWRRRRRAGLPRIPLLVLISLKLDSLFPV